VITEREEAAEQANNIKRTAKERGKKGDPSEFARKPSTRERKQEMRSIPLLRSLQEPEWRGQEKTNV